MDESLKGGISIPIECLSVSANLQQKISTLKVKIDKAEQLINKAHDISRDTCVFRRAGNMEIIHTLTSRYLSERSEEDGIREGTAKAI